MPPTSTIGFGFKLVSSDNLVPSPPAKIKTFIYLFSNSNFKLRYFTQQSFINAEIIVTTDDESIKKTVASSRYSQNVNIIDRPAELAQDNSNTLDVIVHVLHYKNNSNYSHFILLQPTSPLRNFMHIQKAWELYKKEEADTLVSVVASNHPPQKMLIRENGDVYPLTCYEDLTKPRQMLPKAYLPNGAIYICKINNFIKSKNLFEGRLVLFEMSEEESIDIDTYNDIAKAQQLLMQSLNFKKG